MDERGDRKIFQRIDVMATTKNSITVGWKLRTGNETGGGKVVRGYAVNYHALGSSIKQGVESLGPSLVTYVIKQLHENTVYEICVRAFIARGESQESPGIYRSIRPSQERSVLPPRELLAYSQVLRKRSKDTHSASKNGGNDNDPLPAGTSSLHSVLSTSSTSDFDQDGVKSLNDRWDESCITSSTASSSLSLAVGSTLGAFLALGVIVLFVLVAKWQHKNRRQRMKKRWIASNISAAERLQRFNQELLQLDDLSDPCSYKTRPWSTDSMEIKDSQSRDDLAVDDARLKARELETNLVLPDESEEDGGDAQDTRNREAIDVLRRILLDENIRAESFVISTPSIKDGSESYNLLVPLSSAQSLLPYLIDHNEDEFPVPQNRHLHQFRSGSNCRVPESVRKLKFKKHFTIDYSGCANEIPHEQNPRRDLENALQQQVNPSFSAKQSRLFKLQTLKTVEYDSSLECDEFQERQNFRSNAEANAYIQQDDVVHSPSVDADNSTQLQDNFMQPGATGMEDDDVDGETLCRSLSVEW